VDLVVETEKETSVEDVNNKFIEASKTEMKGILSYSTEPLVSVDYTGNPYSSIVDLGMTSVIKKNFVKVFSWYDNEWGYSCRLIDLAKYVGKFM